MSMISAGWGGLGITDGAPAGDGPGRDPILTPRRNMPRITMPVVYAQLTTRMSLGAGKRMEIKPSHAFVATLGQLERKRNELFLRMVPRLRPTAGLQPLLERA